jgi:hypothetical protein
VVLLGFVLTRCSRGFVIEYMQALTTVDSTEEAEGWGAATGPDRVERIAESITDEYRKVMTLVTLAES